MSRGQQVLRARDWASAYLGVEWRRCLCLVADTGKAVSQIGEGKGSRRIERPG